jgi:hypothetical protein
MLGNHKLILDTHSEVYRELLPWADGEFWDLKQHEIVPGAVYIMCREQVNNYNHEIQELARSGQVTVILDNAAEGSETLVTWCFVKGLINLIEEGRILLIGGGDMDPAKWPYMSYEYFLPKIFDFDENVAAGARIDEYFSITDKPYKFLFLNGRMRSHRKYLLERFQANGLLDQSLWTNLDTDLRLITTLPQERWQNFNNINVIKLRFEQAGIDVMERPIDLHFLPKEYETPAFKNNIDHLPSTGTVKFDLFNNTWGDAVTDGTAYRDTYFSLVTETVFNYPYSFRTEKIWKPVAVGHPWIAVANCGFYRDIRNLGFQTFNHVIDESFDQIDNSQDRIERIAQVVEDLCQQDLASFYKECYNVCKYNQQHYAEFRHRVPRELPENFSQFVKKYLANA